MRYTLMYNHPIASKYNTLQKTNLNQRKAHHHASTYSTTKISQEQADQIVNILGLADVIDDSEVFEAEGEYRYFIENSTNTVIIGFDGSAKLVNENGELLSREHFIDFEHVGQSLIRYWHGGIDCGTLLF